MIEDKPDAGANVDFSTNLAEGSDLRVRARRLFPDEEDVVREVGEDAFIGQGASCVAVVNDVSLGSGIAPSLLFARADTGAGGEVVTDAVGGSVAGDAGSVPGGGAADSAGFSPWVYVGTGLVVAGALAGNGGGGGSSGGNAQGPTLSITSNLGVLKIGDTAVISFTFSDDPGSSFVWDGATGDVVVSGGILGAISGSGLVRSAIFTPATGIADGVASITVASGAYTDAAGNAGAAASLSGVRIDTLAPTVTITDNVTGLADVETGDITFTFTFSESVAGFETTDIEVVNATKGAFTALGGSVYTLVVTPPFKTVGNITVDVAAGCAVDAAGNGNLVAIQAVQAFDTVPPTLPIDLSNIAGGGINGGGFVINGESEGDVSGRSVAFAGDVNGDGLADLIIGANGSDPAAGSNAGRCYVVFGQTGTSAVDLSALTGGGGFAINGQYAGEFSGRSVSAAGDINGDGLGDLIVGAVSALITDSDAGRSYVVFGQTGTGAIDLSAVASGGASSGGFVIYGQCTDDRSGYSVAAAGDVNGDGLADLVIGAYLADPVAGDYAGRSYVVFGQTGTSAINLSAVAGDGTGGVGSGGFVVNGQCAYDRSGFSVCGAGDVNGDGLADLIIGARTSDPALIGEAGRSYVVFGQTGTNAVDLSAVAGGAGGGFVINGWCAYDESGESVAAAGDVNGDGLSDLIVGARWSDTFVGNDAGCSYVVFGRIGTNAVDLSTIASGAGGGFVINGQCALDFSGRSVAAAGDVNGDGLSDLIIGAPTSDPAAGGYAGRSYVVFGQTGTNGIDLTTIASGSATSGGFVINGQCEGDSSGQSVAAAGDVNGDGLADLVVGAYLGDPAGGINAGRSYVIFGGTSGAFTQTAVDQLGTSGNDTLTGSIAAETLVAGAGDDTLVGNGGADVLYGGAGDDTFILDAGNLAALVLGVTDGNYARIDGGSGLDTLFLFGGGLDFDLTIIANQGGAGPSSASRIESIERIDLTGSGDNTLILTYNDVIDMADMNRFNNATGWNDGIYDLAAGGANGINPEQRHQLVIDGNANDVVNSTGWGASAGTVIFGGTTYEVYNQGLHAQLLIDQEITRNVV